MANKPYNSGQWTEARRRSFITSALRRASWPVKYESLRKAEGCREKNPKTGRLRNMYGCADCGYFFPAKEVSIDHITPVVPVSGHDSWDEFIERIFCELDGFQVLCRDCHKVKTDAENDERKRLKKERQNGSSK